MAMELSFFRDVRNVDTSRDYTILVDMSGSMAGSRWKQVSFLVRYGSDRNFSMLISDLQLAGAGGGRAHCSAYVPL